MIFNSTLYSNRYLKGWRGHRQTKLEVHRKAKWMRREVAALLQKKILIIT
jgi:hypothetical protein